MLYFLFFSRWHNHGASTTAKPIEVFILSGIITALPILTLINMGMQMKNMKEDTFHTVLQNTVFGAVGMLLFTVLVFLLTSWFKPGISVMSALAVYAVFMLSGKYILSMFA